jgi:DNA-binding CsgD family transcriptional regulator/PAS domain-containing protein
MKIDGNALDLAVDGLLQSVITGAGFESGMIAMTQAVGAFGANILPVIGRVPGFPSTPSMDGALNAYFEDEWQYRDFRNKGLPHFLSRGSMLEQDYASAEDFKTQGYYKMHEKFGIRWTAIIGFSTEKDQMGFIFHRSLAQGFFERDEERVLQRIRSRLSIVATLSKALNVSQMDGMGRAFEQSDLACLFFDRFGTVISANPTAERLIGDGLTITNGQISCWRSQDGIELRKAVHDAIYGRLLSHSTGGQVVISRSEKRPLLCRVQRMPQMANDILIPAAAIAIISDLSATPRPSISTMISLFGFTRMEANVALVLGMGGTAREAGDHFGISYETVRTHIASILRKTGTSRQAELIMLLSRACLV